MQGVFWFVFTVYFISPALSQGRTSIETDPCTSVTPVLIDDDGGYRSPLKASSAFLCDYRLEERWYRILSPRGDDMPIACPRRGVCGTDNPVWLNGNIPGIAEGVVTRKACVTYGSDCCDNTLNIQIRNCTDFLLYRLLPTGFCPSAYCFGTKPIPRVKATTATLTAATVSKLETTTRTFKDVHMKPALSWVIVTVISVISIVVSVTVLSLVVVVIFRRNRTAVSGQTCATAVETMKRPITSAPAVQKRDEQIFHLKTKIETFVIPTTKDIH